MARQPLNASQSEPSFSDGLGLRFVRTPGTGESVEALRLRPELATLGESIREPIEAPAAIAQTERPTLDGDFTREIQVESIAQPSKAFEIQGAGLEGTSRRRRRRTGSALRPAIVSAAGGGIRAAVKGADVVGRMLQRCAWPSGIAAIAAGARLTVTTVRAARLGAIRLNLHPERRLQVLASTLVLLVTVCGIPLVKAHWSDGVTATAQFSTTLTTGIKRADPREWWPARQQGIGATALDGAVRLDRTPAPRSSDSGSLTVSSSPDGAEVWLDGAWQGRAPITLDGVSAGAHTVLVRGRTGSVRRAVRVQPGGTAGVAINIYSGWLVVFAPIGLDVLEDGRSIGTSETGRIRLSPGEHHLEIVNERIGFRESHTSEVIPGDTVAINVDLPPAMLEISAPPDTEVLIDGQMIGTTPIEPVPVAVGTREVTLRHPTLGEQHQRATITYRTPNRILFRPPG